MYRWLVLFMTISETGNSVQCLGAVEQLLKLMELQDRSLSLDNKYYQATLYFSTEPSKEAVIYHLDNGQSLPKELLQDIDAEIKIVVGELDDDHLSLECIDLGYEYIAWEGEEGGRRRVIECLEAHTWPDMSLKAPSSPPITESRQPQLSNEILDLHQTLFEYSDIDSFERSLHKIQELRRQLQECDGEARLDLAEQIAQAFDLALAEDDEFDEFVSG
jgi:hypothetical protein